MAAKFGFCTLISVVAATEQEQFVLLQANKLARSERKPIIWFHLHKYGGSMICQKAKQNGENVTVGYDNCQMPPDGFFDQDGENQVHCKERVASGFSFSMIERWATQADLNCTDKAVTGIMLRDPVKGAMSNIMFHRFDEDYTNKMLDRILNSSGPVLAPRLDNKDYMYDPAPHFSNFMTRSLAAGPGDYLTGEVTDEILERAKSNLDKMDVVLILEDLSKHRAQLRQIFGWKVNTTKEELETIRGERTSDPKERRERFSDEDVRKLELVNQVDYKLLEYGRQVAHQKTQAAQLLE